MPKRVTSIEAWGWPEWRAFAKSQDYFGATDEPTGEKRDGRNG